jgi:hypothetical protein
MKNIHVLPTDKPSRLYLEFGDGALCLVNNALPQTKRSNNQHIYITSDKEIKDGDWFMIFTNKKPIAPTKAGLFDSDCKKIILTTDPDLIKDGVQAIDDEFLEWFVKNPSCEFVETDESKYFDGSHGEYLIIIPQEEPKQETLEEAAKSNYDNKTARLPVPTSHWVNSEFLQIQNFIEGAKWQQEQDKKMYSEEDMKLSFEAGKKGYMRGSMLHQEYYFTWKNFKQWFEQFKKK